MNRFQWAGLIVAAVGAAACADERSLTDVLGPGVEGGATRIHALPLAAANVDKFQFPHGKSEFQCTITSEHSDGKYYRTVAWLRMPAAYKDPSGAVEVYSLEWRPSTGGPAGDPMAGAKCKIPRTPEAEKFLHERVFFIDPKTLRSNGPTSLASLQGAAGYFGSSITYVGSTMAYVTTLPTVLVIGNTPTWMSGSSSRSNPGFGASVPTWNGPDYNYVEPGQPCYNDNLTTDGMIGVEADLSFLALPPETSCPITAFASICLDFYISDCTIAGGTGAGDCRTLSPYATPGQSRAQIVIPLDPALSSLSKVYLSPTCFRGRLVCRGPLGPEYNQVYIQYRDDSSIGVTVRLQNALAIVPPPIDGSFVISPQANGTYNLSAGVRDAYPSLTVVESKNGINRVVMQRDETVTRALSSWFGLQDVWALCIPQL